MYGNKMFDCLSVNLISYTERSQIYIENNTKYIYVCLFFHFGKFTIIVFPLRFLEVLEDHAGSAFPLKSRTFSLPYKMRMTCMKKRKRNFFFLGLSLEICSRNNELGFFSYTHIIKTAQAEEIEGLEAVNYGSSSNIIVAVWMKG